MDVTCQVHHSGFLRFLTILGQTLDTTLALLKSYLDPYIYIVDKHTRDCSYFFNMDIISQDNGSPIICTLAQVVSLPFTTPMLPSCYKWYDTTCR